MKLKQLLFSVLALCSVTLATAQSCDPWITKAYAELYKRKPTATECNIRNYNNGSWGSYCELVEHISKFNSGKSGNHLKGDPWIFRAYCEIYGRGPAALELNKFLYNAGTWNSYDELKRYIRQYQEFANGTAYQVVTGTVNGQDAAVLVDPKNTRTVIGWNIFSKDGGQILNQNNAGIIGSAAYNLISNTGVSIAIPANSAAMTVGNNRTVQSAGTQVIKTSGSGALIIRKL